MSLPLPLAAAAGLFLESLTVFDIITVRIAGRSQATQQPNRFIKGVIQTDKQLIQDIARGGTLADGSLILHTRGLINISDTTQNEGEQNTQTYVLYENDTWLADGLGVNWQAKAQGYNKYALTKFLDISDP